ncbi:MAG: hypothetical protein HYW25_02645 [Candidatus Aenigmarchaeota archaeon]|nr:hypothetical protein [Candidatus Aenigmarchaeota archaeon]
MDKDIYSFLADFCYGSNYPPKTKKEVGHYAKVGDFTGRLRQTERGLFVDSYEINDGDIISIERRGKPPVTYRVHLS